MGAIWRMGIQSHYERDDAHSGAVVAAKWRAIWLEVQSGMGCCQDSAINNYYTSLTYHSSIRLRLQQIYFAYVAASLDISLVFPGIPDEYDADPGDAGDEIAQRNLALCLACESWVDEICNQGTSFIERTVQDAIPIFTGLVAVPFIPTIVTGLVALYAGYFSLAVHKELNNEAYRSYLKCAMYNKLKGVSTVSASGFDVTFDDLPARPPPPEDAVQDDARDVIELWLRGVVNDEENWLGFVSMLNAAMSVAATLAPGTCECYSCEDETYELEGGLPATFVLSPYAGIPAPLMIDPNGQGGIWKAGIGFAGDGIESTVTGETDIINYTVFIEHDPSCIITAVTFKARYEAGGANRGKRLRFADADGNIIYTAWNQGHNPSGAWENRTTGPISVENCSWIDLKEESRTPLDDWVRLDNVMVYN
jgi:hypothetical protein